MNEAQMPAADDRDDADLARYREEEEQEVLGILTATPNSART